jgi:hypothetical protein
MSGPSMINSGYPKIECVSSDVIIQLVALVSDSAMLSGPHISRVIRFLSLVGSSPYESSLSYKLSSSFGKTSTGKFSWFSFIITNSDSLE